MTSLSGEADGGSVSSEEDGKAKGDNVVITPDAVTRYGHYGKCRTKSNC